MNVIKIDKVAAMRERERSVLSLKMQTCKVSLKGYYCYRHCYRSLDLSQEHGKRGSALPRMDGERAGSVNGSIIREKSGDVYLNEDNEGEGRIDETKIILSLSRSLLCNFRNDPLLLSYSFSISGMNRSLSPPLRIEFKQGVVAGNCFCQTVWRFERFG